MSVDVSVPAAALLGIVTWTLLEYVLHRFLGHDRRTMPNPFSVEHTRHHAEGGYFAPAWKKGVAAVLVVGGLFALGRLVVAPALAASFAIGLGGMYVVYETLHWRLHVHAGIGPYARFLRRHHFHHHFGDPRTNHGVTTPVWDVVFGTWRPVTRVRVPRKLRLPWLCDVDGQLRPEFAGTWELLGPG